MAMPNPPGLTPMKALLAGAAVKPKYRYDWVAKEWKAANTAASAMYCAQPELLAQAQETQEEGIERAYRGINSMYPSLDDLLTRGDARASAGWWRGVFGL